MDVSDDRPQEIVSQLLDIQAQTPSAAVPQFLIEARAVPLGTALGVVLAGSQVDVLLLVGAVDGSQQVALDAITTQARDRSILVVSEACELLDSCASLCLTRGESNRAEIHLDLARSKEQGARFSGPFLNLTRVRSREAK